MVLVAIRDSNAKRSCNVKPNRGSRESEPSPVLILTHGNNTIISDWLLTFQNLFFCVCHCLQGRLGEPGESGPKGFQVSYWG